MQSTLWKRWRYVIFITCWFKMCFIFSPSKVTLLGSVIFTFQHTQHLAISKHNLMFLYTIFIVATKVRIQSTYNYYKSCITIPLWYNSAYWASKRNIYLLLLSKRKNLGRFTQYIHDFLKLNFSVISYLLYARAIRKHLQIA